MASNYYSNQDIHIEAFFGETNNVCICSRAHLKDYHTSNNFYNAYDNETCYEDIPEDFESVHSHDEKMKDSTEDPDTCYENAFQEDMELMESMGLPTSFGKKIKDHQNYGYYSACNHDENNSENEENVYFEKYEQHDEHSDDNNCTKYQNLSHCEKNVMIGDITHMENDSEFSNFWTLHGYTVCLNSWIKKYKDHISPEYLQVLLDQDNLKSKGIKLSSNICPSDNDQCEMDNCSALDIPTNQNCENSEILHDDDNFTQNINANSTGNENDDEMHKNDHALKNINDKFQCMSFSDGNEALPENVEDLEISLESNDLYLEDVLPSNEDLTVSEFNSDLLEKVVFCLDSQPVVDLSSKTVSKSENELASNPAVNESNKLKNISDINAPIEQETNFDNNFKLLKFLIDGSHHIEQTENPLFIHTTSEEEYVERISNITQTWEELWASHCQEEYDKYSNFFSENSVMLSKYFTSDSQKCKLCGSDMCKLDCQNDIRDCNDDLHNKILSNKDSRNNLKFSTNKLSSYPDVDCYASKDLSVPDNILTFDCSSEIKQDYDGEPLLELPIKRPHEITESESEDEDPEDMIKELGLVIQPANSLIIKKNNYHKCYKRHRNQYRSNDEEDRQFILDPESQDIHINHEDNEVESSNFTGAGYEKLVSNENVNYEGCKELIPNENVNYEGCEELITNKNLNYEGCKELIPNENVNHEGCKELIPNENVEYEESEPTENIDHMEEANDSSEPDFEYKNDIVMNKYWHQRYRLFNRFDEGIKLDEESWFSVTPERIAEHIAERCACGVMVDAFCGAGGNAIQFASYCYHVIAIDIDPNKIELAKHNATIYGVADYIDFIVGDYFDIAPLLKADGVFLSPPWGGPSYAKEAEYNIERIEPNMYKVFEVSKRISQNIALFVPKNTIINQLVQLSGEGNNVEIEQNFLNKKVKTITAYYGDFVSQSSIDTV